MATRSGGKKPQSRQAKQAKQAKTAKQKKPASFNDTLEDGNSTTPPSPAPVLAKLTGSTGWAMIFVLLLLAFAVAIWGIWQPVSMEGPMEIRFPAATQSPAQAPLAETLPGNATDTEKPVVLAEVPAEALRGDERGDETDLRMAALEAGLAALENRPVPDIPTPGAPDPATAQALDSMESTLAALLDRMVELESRLQRAELSDQVGWALVISGAELRTALRGSAPFAAELKTFRGAVAALGGGDGLLNAALAAVDAYASEGIPTLESLNGELAALAPRLMAVSGQEETSLEEKDWITELRGRLASLVTIRRTGSGVTGSSAEAVVARAEAALAAGDLKTAVTEMETLQGDSALLAAPWLAGARGRLAAEQSLAGISRQVTAVLARDETRRAPDAEKGAPE